jgi:hypothetical protein
MADLSTILSELRTVADTLRNQYEMIFDNSSQMSLDSMLAQGASVLSYERPDESPLMPFSRANQSLGTFFGLLATLAPLSGASRYITNDLFLMARQSICPLFPFC